MKSLAGRSLDRPIKNGGMPGAVRLDQTVAGSIAPRVNPQYSHQNAISGGLFHGGLIDVEVRPDILDIFLVFEGFHEF